MDVNVKMFGKDAYDLFHYTDKCPDCKSIIEFLKGSMKPVVHYVHTNCGDMKQVALAVRCPVCGTYIDENFKKLYVKIEDVI